MIDKLRQTLVPRLSLETASPEFFLFAFAAVIRT
jgi:hypothetical protein